jgi:DNA polymerase-3 subunit delta'
MNDRLRTRGHEVAQRAVGRWIAAAHAPHAILLAGPPNVGKTTLALDLTAGLLCLADDPAARPCRACLACRKVDGGVHPDVHRLAPQGAGGQIRIAAVRELVTDLALLPLEGRCRVAIVESAERLNEDAQNALLKTLEEPPAGAVLVLCVGDEEPILPTVRSRCVRISMGPVAPRTVAAFLAERGLDDPARAARIARLAWGRPGLALTIAGRPEVEVALGRIARHLLDLVRADRRTRLADAADLISDGAVLDGLGLAIAPEDAPPTDADPTPAGRGPAPSAPAERRRAVAALLGVWRSVARDLALVGRGGRAGIRWVDLLEELEATAAGLAPDAAERFLERIERTSALVDANANPELALDALLLAWPRTSA